MKELLVRTLSGAVLVAVIVACIFISPWTLWAMALFIVGMGTFEMSRLMKIKSRWQLVLGMCVALSAFVVATPFAEASDLLFAIEMLLIWAPFLFALFSHTDDFKSIASYNYASIALLCIPCFFMVWMRDTYSPKILMLVFVLLWANDTFAYLTGRLLGKHKLCERISPGKTIEGSLGGLVFTLAGVIVFSQYVDWLPTKVAVGMGLIAVVFGTLGDLCESMLKRQAGVKDSGKLIPGHGGILDRFDSVLFTLPFMSIYLLMFL